MTSRGIAEVPILMWVSGGAITLLATIALAYAGTANTRADTASQDITKTSTALHTLCNDYSQTVYRIDQNLQILGKALKADIVSGNSNVNPCQQ